MRSVTNDRLDTTVFRATRLIVTAVRLGVRRDGTRFTVRLYRDPFPLDALLDQFPCDCLRPATRKDQVVFLCAEGVGVTFEKHSAIRRSGMIQDVCHPLDYTSRLRIQIVAVELEVRMRERDDNPTGRFRDLRKNCAGRRSGVCVAL